MRKRVWMTWMLLIWLAAIPASAQETRGTISGTVRDKDGVLPGATVKITNTGTNVSQQLVTNGSGYFEAPLLIAGDVRSLGRAARTSRASGRPASSSRSASLSRSPSPSRSAT